MAARIRRRRNTRVLKTWLFIGGGLVAVVVLLVGLTLAFSGPQVRESELGLANPATDMTLAALSGEFQLSEHKGEVLLLYFSFPG